MNFVSWNYRGLGNSSKVEAVNDLIRMDSPDVLMLQETKIDEDSLLSISCKRWKTNVGNYSCFARKRAKNSVQFFPSFQVRRRILETKVSKYLVESWRSKYLLLPQAL